MEGVLSEDMSTVSEYLQTWKLMISITKTVKKNKEAKRGLKVHHNSETLPFGYVLKCLGGTLDRSHEDRLLTYRRHLDSLRKKLTSRVALLSWLWLGCWSNNVANSHLNPGTFNSIVLRSCLVP